MKLVKNMIYNATYQLLALLLPLITTPYVTRVLTPKGMGIYAYTNSIVTYFTLIAALGISLYGNREVAYVQKEKEARSKIFWELIYLKVIASSIAVMLYVIVLAFFITDWKTYFFLQGINLFSILMDISWYFTGREDFKKIVVRNTIIRVTLIVLTFVLVKKASDLGMYIFLTAVSSLLGNLSVWPFLKKEINKVPFSELNIWRHVKPTLYLFFPQITMQIYLSLNKSMLGWMTGVVSAGYFDQSDKIIRILFTLVAALGGVFLPRLSSLFSENKKEEAKLLLLKLIDLSNAISILLISGVVAVSGTFATFYFGEEYAAVGPLMQVQSLMIIFISYGNALGTQYLLASKRMRDYIVSSVVGLITNILFNFILIPVMGAMGAVVSTLLTEGVVTGYQAYSLRDVFSFNELTSGLWKYLVAGLITIYSMYHLNTNMSVSIVNYSIQTVIGVGVYGITLVVLKAPVIKLIKDFKK
ncbi:TPA: flippase [Streptococcus suis]|nr:flippase [Streptococcus suis]